MKRYEFIVLEWIDVKGKGQPVIGTFTHFLKNDQRATVMAEKISNQFTLIVAIITVQNGEAISIMLPVSVSEKGSDACTLAGLSLSRSGGEYPTASKIELFARRSYKNWDMWGNEVANDNSPA
jgi:N6-adenosine-specific RNA methylase IME4